MSMQQQPIKQMEINMDNASTPNGKENLILVIDDDQKIRKLLAEFLTQHGFQVLARSNGEDVLSLLANENIQCVVLDVVIPGEDGLAICKKIRAQHITPIIMLTALGEEPDRMIGLEVGADDYLPKPFHPRELLARIKALLRRVAFYQQSAETNHSGFSKYRFLDWDLDTHTHQLLSPDKIEIHITSAEYNLLLALLKNPQRVLSRDQLLDAIYEGDAGSLDRTIDIHISRLRQKIEEDVKNPKIIKTVRNGGYIMAARVEKC